MIINCFEKDENNENVWHRSISNGKGWINLASLKDEETGQHKDIMRLIKNLKMSIKRKRIIIFLLTIMVKPILCVVSQLQSLTPKFLTVMVYDEDFNASQVYVSNEDEMDKVRDYLNKNKC